MRLARGARPCIRLAATARPRIGFRRPHHWNKKDSEIPPVEITQHGKSISLIDKDEPAHAWGLADAMRTVRTAATALPAQLLPKGYPSSVSPTYLPYALWHGASAVLSAAGGVLSMQALLHAVGVGAGSVPLAASLQWVLKDGLGQLGGILFAGAVSSKYDTDVKRWRLASAAALDAACLLECALPLMPGLFLPVAAVANVAKNVAWLSASATRAGIHQSLAQGGTLADVTAKSGSQSIAASVAGTALGMGVASFVPWVCEGTTVDPAVGALVAFATISSGHLLCLWQALRELALPTLNQERAGLCAAAFLPDVSGAIAGPGSQSSESSASEPSEAAWGVMMPTPEDARRAERLFVTPRVTRALGIRIGAEAPSVGSAGDAYRRWSKWEARIPLVISPKIQAGDLERCGLATEAGRAAASVDAGNKDRGAMVWARVRDGGGDSGDCSVQMCLSIPVGADWRAVLLGHLRAEAARCILVEEMEGKQGQEGAGGVSREQVDRAIERSNELVFGRLAGGTGLEYDRGAGAGEGEEGVSCGLGQRWIDRLEEAGWWVGRPLLEEDVEDRLMLNRIR